MPRKSKNAKTPTAPKPETVETVSTKVGQAVVVRKIATRPGVIPNNAAAVVGKPRKIIASAMRSKIAYPSGGGTTSASAGNFYSPELSTDFLELPQSIDEKRNYYRFFYQSHPFVGQAIDLHTELPLSKIRLGMPKAKDP